jgi:hypothetical protein
MPHLITVPRRIGAPISQSFCIYSAVGDRIRGKPSAAIRYPETTAFSHQTDHVDLVTCWLLIEWLAVGVPPRHMWKLP